jgi:hypothetical protein
VGARRPSGSFTFFIGYSCGAVARTSIFVAAAVGLGPDCCFAPFHIV